MAIFNYNVDKVRSDFEILSVKKPVIYFDNACMTFRPKQVVESMNEYYREFPSCALRSHHRLSRIATEKYENSRKIVSKFIGSPEDSSVVFTRNTTEGINLVANSVNLSKGDSVLISDKEHNSNLVPWQQMVRKKGIKLKILRSRPDNTFDIDKFSEGFKSEIKLVAFGMTSNLDGVSVPLKEIVKISHENGARVMLDGAQGVPHQEINVKKMDVDLLAFSGHKMCGPTGIGVLYGKSDILEKMDPFLVGGETVYDTTYLEPVFERHPMKFEAGLQNYAGSIGLSAACEYLKKLGVENIYEREVKLNRYVYDQLKPEIDSGVLSVIGPQDPKFRGGIFTFNIKGVDPHEVALTLDSSSNIALRSGAFCVHSWFNDKKLNGAVRASFYLYNTVEEVDVFIKSLRDIIKIHK